MESSHEPLLFRVAFVLVDALVVRISMYEFRFVFANMFGVQVVRSRGLWLIMVIHTVGQKVAGII